MFSLSGKTSSFFSNVKFTEPTTEELCNTACAKSNGSLRDDIRKELSQLQLAVNRGENVTTAIDDIVKRYQSDVNAKDVFTYLFPQIADNFLKFSGQPVKFTRNARSSYTFTIEKRDGDIVLLDKASSGKERKMMTLMFAPEIPADTSAVTVPSSLQSSDSLSQSSTTQSGSSFQSEESLSELDGEQLQSQVTNKVAIVPPEAETGMSVTLEERTALGNKVSYWCRDNNFYRSNLGPLEGNQRAKGMFDKLAKLEREVRYSKKGYTREEFSELEKDINKLFSYLTSMLKTPVSMTDRIKQSEIIGKFYDEIPLQIGVHANAAPALKENCEHCKYLLQYKTDLLKEEKVYTKNEFYRLNIESMEISSWVDEALVKSGMRTL